MKEISCNAICIRSIDYKDNDKLITLYAQDIGKILVNARGVKKAKAKLRYASNVFCFGKYYLTENKGYYTLIGCDMMDSFYDIWSDIDKYYPALAVIEILDKLSLDSEISNQLFSNVIDFLNEIAYKKIHNISMYMAKFLYDTLSLIGYHISTKGCNVCGRQTSDSVYFSNNLGGIVFDCCKDSEAIKLTTEEFCLIKDIENDKISFSYSSEVFSKIIYLFIRYFEAILTKRLVACKEYYNFITNL